MQMLLIYKDARAFIMKQIKRPAIVGNSAEISVHLRLFVSFFIVISVVEQGQWKSEKTMVQRAVIFVQPLFIRVCASNAAEKSLIPVEPVYTIRIMGKTISFAGSPSIKPKSIAPSKPKSLPRGSKKVLV